MDATTVVKTLSLETLPDDSLPRKMEYLSGQWCDFHVENIGTGGFSFTTTPQDSRISLAIRYTPKDPVVRWIHEVAKVGDQVKMRVGGDFYWKRTDPPQRNVLLLAAGMGITPIFSIAKTIAHENQTLGHRVLARLLYSSKETLFVDKLCQLKQFGIELQFRQTPANQRFTPDDIKESLREADQVYLCGPSRFESNVLETLESAGFPQDSIKFEKWW